MHERNWGLINSGPAFEALVEHLVYFQDPKAALLGRRGRDGGQDAISENKTLVHQAKHHELPSAAKAIADALGEAQKIARYKNKDHSNYPLWEKVTVWRLYTNAVFNPSDDKLWNDRVTPIFRELNIRAECYTRTNVDALLAKYPEVDRVFFQNESRVFLTIPEARDLPFVDKTFKNEDPTPLTGRISEIQSIRNFLSHRRKRILGVYGQGGIGKTKLAIEVGEEIASEGEWQVLWANVETMTLSTQWLMGIVPERNTLLLIDEPRDERLINSLIEHLYGGRMKNWKVVITARSYKDPILKALGDFRIESVVDMLNLAPLSPEHGKTMCLALIEKGVLSKKPEEWKRLAAAKLSQGFNNIPVWMTLAIDELEKRGDLNSLNFKASDFADLYVAELTASADPRYTEKMLSVLRWIALLGGVNREDGEVLQLVSDEVGVSNRDELLLILKDLTKKQGMIQWGARNRFVEIKPDVVRDHILINWFFIKAVLGSEEMRITQQAKQLMDKILDGLHHYGLNDSGKKILVSLARVESLLKLSNENIALLEDFFDRLTNGLPHSASTRIAVIEALTLIAGYHPHEIVKLSKKLRSDELSEEASKTILGNRSLSRNDVILEIGWLLYHAFPGADSEADPERMYGLLLNELCFIRGEEERIAMLNQPVRWLNTGKSAGHMLGRIFESPRQFRRSFNDAVYKQIQVILKRLKRYDWDKPVAMPLKELIEVSTSVERREVGFSGYKMSVESYTLLTGSLPWIYRQKIVSLIKDEIADPCFSVLDIRMRIFFWNTFTEAHENARRALGVGNEKNQIDLRQALLDDLKWLLSFVNKSMPIEELRAMNRLWSWYLEFDAHPDLADAARKLELKYQENEIIHELTPLLAFDGSSRSMDEGRELALAKAEDLAADDSVVAIRSFFNAAVSFSLEGHTNYVIRIIAQKLGSFAANKASIRSYIFESLAISSDELNKNIAFEVIVGWIRELRELNKRCIHEVVSDILSHCSTDEDRINVIFGIYCWNIQGPTLEERDYVYSLENLFLRNNSLNKFIQVIEWTSRLDWDGYKHLVENLFSGLPMSEKHNVLIKVIETVYLRIKNETPIQSKIGLIDWLFSMIIRLDDMDRIHPVEWQLNELSKKMGRMPLTWLPEAINSRLQLKAESIHGPIRVLGSQFSLAYFVEGVSKENYMDKSVRSSVIQIVNLIKDGDLISYILPIWIKSIDPEGLLIPDIVAELITKGDDSSGWRRLRRVAMGYPLNSGPWRKIAIATANRAEQESDGNSVFHDLTNAGMRSWSSSPGEVPILFIKQLEDAACLLSTETDASLKPLWEWNLNRAQKELKDREEEAKEQMDRFVNE